jgi:O-antigen chain-terminating methyltransferase
VTQQPVDLDAILAEVRARVRQKRESGIYGPDLDAALTLPLPGGRPIFSEELKDPFLALPEVLDEDNTYDPKSRKRYVGPVITLARRTLIGLLRWWLAAITERQERINQLVARALFDLRDRPTPGLEARLRRLEQWHEDFTATNLNSIYFQARFGGDEPVIRRQSEAFADLFAGRKRVVDLGCGRGIFLGLMRDKGVGAYGVDLDPRMVSQCGERGLECVLGDALGHLRSLPDGAIDGLYARHIAEHLLPGELVSLLTEAHRVLTPGAPVVFVTPNVANLSVGAHSFWLDPSHVRPIPPELFRFYLEVVGFEAVDVRTFEPSETRLSEKVADATVRENVKLLNETLFGDRDYAVVGRAKQ